MSTCTVDPAELYIARLGTDHSRRTARAALRTVATLLGVEAIDWGVVTYAEWAAVRAGLGNYSVAWANACWSITRSLLREAQRLGAVDGAIVDAVHALPWFHGESGRLGRDLDDDDIAALLNVVDQTTTSGRRDGAVCALLMAGALRRSECVAVDVDDWFSNTRRLRVERGKGQRYREVPMPKWAAELLDEWLDVHPGDGRLLRAVHRTGNIGNPLSPRSVHSIVTRLCAVAGIDAASPHAFRAHRISEILDAGDPLVAQRLAGHSTLQTTSRYDRRPVDRLASVIDGLDCPRPSRSLRAAS